VAVKSRDSLLEALTRFEGCLEECLGIIKHQAAWILNSHDTHELAQTVSQIDLIELTITKLSRELASVSHQIRVLLVAETRCVAMAEPTKRANLLSESHGASLQRSAFAAVNVGNGAVVVRVRKDTSEVWPQKEYGRFESWTQAQNVATLLNERHGLDIMEAQHIVVSASLAAATSRGQKS
jgi:hypothetical protein